MSEVTDDHAALNAAIDAIEPSDARASYGELSRTAALHRAVSSCRWRSHFYSDMQQIRLPAEFQRPAPGAECAWNRTPIGGQARRPTSRSRT